MVGQLVSYWDGLFSGAMLVLGSVFGEDFQFDEHIFQMGGSTTS